MQIQLQVNKKTTAAASSGWCDCLIAIAWLLHFLSVMSDVGWWWLVQRHKCCKNKNAVKKLYLYQKLPDSCRRKETKWKTVHSQSRSTRDQEILSNWLYTNIFASNSLESKPKNVKTKPRNEKAKNINWCLSPFFLKYSLKLDVDAFNADTSTLWVKKAVPPKPLPFFPPRNLAK